MKFDLISDFHVEMNQVFSHNLIYDWPGQKQNPVLVVAGDISNDDEKFSWVLTEAAQYYDLVLVVDGNHDHYWTKHRYVSLTDSYQRLREFCERIPQVHFLPDGPHRIGNVLFCGRNGWYDFRAAEGIAPAEQKKIWYSEINDRRYIGFEPERDPNVLAREHVEELVREVTDAQTNDEIEQIVMITHTIPHLRGAVPMTHEWYPLNGAYVNTQMNRVVEADVKKKITTWVFGHTHFLYDFFDEHIHYKTNPRGYRGERRPIDFSSIVQVDTDEKPGSAFGEIE